MPPTRRTSFIEWLIESTPETVKRWINQDDLRPGLAAYLDAVWAERVDTPEWLTGYAKACPIDDAGPGEYRLREVDLPSGAAVLAGIHFMARDVRRPFVNVLAQSREFTDAEVLAATAAMAAAFALFKPLYVRWWSPEQRELRHLPGAAGDHRLVVGRLRDIAQDRQAVLPDGFSFNPEHPAGCYEQYARAYAGFLAESTVMAGRMTCESRRTLEECARAGALSVLRDGDRVAGLMAARPKTSRGMSGWEVVEEFLWADYRGRGLAVAMQRRFISALDSSHGELVFGEIHDRNQPSLRTAVRAGRRDAGGWVFVDG